MRKKECGGEEMCSVSAKQESVRMTAEPWGTEHFIDS